MQNRLCDDLRVFKDVNHIQSGWMQKNVLKSIVYKMIEPKILPRTH